jgi:hypothetical protein
MAAPTTNFRVNAPQYLGHQYQEFCNDLYALAISEPDKYFTMRKNVLKKVKQDAIGAIYDTFYNLLVEGRVGTSNVFVNDMQPQYPEQKVSEIALSAANTLDNILNKVIELVLPIDYRDIALKRIGERANPAAPAAPAAP